MKIFGFNISRGKVETKTSPDAAAWIRGDDADDNSLGAKLVHPYAQSTWIYVAVSTLAVNVSQIPFRICQVSKTAKEEGKKIRRKRGVQDYRNFRKKILLDNVVESGEVVDLFQAPHPSMDRALYWQTIMSWRLLRGEFFIAPLDRDDRPVNLREKNPRIERLMPLAADLFWHIVTGFELEGWRYTGSPLLSPIPSQVLLPGEIIHQRTFNPYLFWRGLSPVTLAMVTAAGDYAAEQFMKGLMMNNADTGVIVQTEQQLDITQREQMLAALKERKRKAGTPDRPLLLWGGASIQKPTVSSADMQFIENRKLNRETIAAIFRVPMSMMGITERQQSLGGGPGQEQERLSFFESVIAPHCRDLEAAHDPVVKSFDPSYECYFDIDDLPILQEARRQRLDSAQKAFAMGYPINQINELYDLGFEPVPWGDEGFLPFSLQPISVMKEPAAPAEEPPPDDPNATPTAPEKPAEPANEPVQNMARLFDDLSNPVTRMLKTLSPSPSPLPKGEGAPSSTHGHVCSSGSEQYEAAFNASAKAKKGRLQKFFMEQRARVLAKLPGALKEFELVANTAENGSQVSYWRWKPEGVTSRGLDDIWDSVKENAALLARLKPNLIADLEAGGAKLFEEIGLDNFSLPPADAIKFLDARKPAIAGVNQTTWDRVKEQLQEGLQAGDALTDLTDRVKQVFQAASLSRAEIIAQTETNTAMNSGRHEAMVMAKVPRKGWQTSHLENTRATHLENEQLSNAENGIEIDEEWPNGLMYPGDPKGEPGETINCRCFGFAILDK